MVSVSITIKESLCNACPWSSTPIANCIGAHPLLRLAFIATVGHHLAVESNPMRSINAELMGFPLFKGLTESAVESLCHGASLRLNNHRDVLFERGNPAEWFGVVLSGAYKLTRINPLGEDAVVHFSAYGDVIGALVLSQPNSVYPVTSTAMGPSRALLIPRATYLKSWMVNPNLLSQVQGLFSNRIDRFQTQKAMQRSPLPAKVATILLQIVSKSHAADEL